MTLSEEILNFSEAVLFRRILQELADRQEDFAPVNRAYREILAHYYGFLLGDRLLYYTEPGYLPDTALSMRYGREIRETLHVK